MPEGDIHPDLVNRLAREARDTAAHVLQMCIRGIDYCPPVDITFGDYLRAVITADLDINPNDEFGYRVAFVESFREWGIYPQGIKSMSVESLCWPSFEETFSVARSNISNEAVSSKSVKMHGMSGKIMAQTSLNSYLDAQLDASDRGERAQKRGKESKRKTFEALDLRQDRYELWKQMDANGYHIWRWLTQENEADLVHALGLVMDSVTAQPTVFRNKYNQPTIEVHSARPIVLNVDEFGEQNFIVVEVLQRRRGYLDPQIQKTMDAPGTTHERDETGDFIYRAGCTFLINPENKEIRWVMRTAGTINDDNELERMRTYLTGNQLPNRNEFAVSDPQTLGLRSGGEGRDEPFALLHDSAEV